MDTSRSNRLAKRKQYEEDQLIRNIDQGRPFEDEVPEGLVHSFRDEVDIVLGESSGNEGAYLEADQIDSLLAEYGMNEDLLSPEVQDESWDVATRKVPGAKKRHLERKRGRKSKYGSDSLAA